MVKNKILILIFCFPVVVQAAITKEHFMGLADDKKWDLYVGHNACYQRIFKNKDEEIARLEQLVTTSQKWQNVAIGSLFISAAAMIIAVGTCYTAITNPDALRR